MKQFDFVGYLFSMISGALIGYCLTVLGGFVSQNQFLDERFHKLYERKSHEWFSVHCRFLNFGLITLSLTPAIAASLPRFLVLMNYNFGGSRRILMIAYALVLVGGLLSTSKLLVVFCFGLIVIGLGVGATSMVIPMYINQIYIGKARGRLTLVFYFFMGIGIAISSVVSYITSNTNSLGWTGASTGICSLASSLFLLSLSLESVETKNQRPTQIQTQFLLLHKSQWIPAFFISFATQIFAALTGSIPASFYFPIFFGGLGIRDLKVLIYSMILITLNFSGLSGSALLFPRFGARRTVFFTGSLMAITLSFIAGTMYMRGEYSKDLLSSIFVLGYLAVYTIAYNTCFGLLGWLDVSYPKEIMFMGLAISFNTNLALTVVISEVNLIMLCYMGSGIFIFYIGIILIMMICVYFVLPETYLGSRP